MKELDETAYWLELIRRAELLDEARFTELEKEVDELTAVFVTIIKNSGN